MSSLIKACLSEGNVRPVALRPSPAVDDPLPGPSREAQLEAQIADLEREIAEAERRLPELIEEAREKAASKAHEQRSTLEQEALAEIRATAERALIAWEERLASLDSIAIGLARETLGRVFADSGERADAVASALRRRLSELAAQAVIGVRVSGEDFASAEAMDSLSVSLESHSLAVAVDPKLASGICSIDLKLGHIDVGPKTQWARISALLEGFENEAVRK